MLKVKNWDQFQHYKDRDPPWIKLHRGLLEDYDFNRLSDINKAHLMLIWILASRCGNRLPEDPSWVAARIGATKPVDLGALVSSGFLEFSDDEQERPRAEGWGSRYISADVKALVMERDGGKCQMCPSAESIEFDHVVPVSKGGSSEADNIQLLCRRCNRSKRAKSAEQLATQKTSQRSLETEGETEGEKRQKPVEYPAEFERIWSGTGKIGGKHAALVAWKKQGQPEAEAVLIVWKAYMLSARPVAGYVKDLSSWFNARFHDQEWEPARPNGTARRSTPMPDPEQEAARAAWRSKTQ